MRSLSLRSGNSPTTPYGGRVNGLQIIGFPPPCHPNYGALALTPAGLSPAERASLLLDAQVLNQVLLVATPLRDSQHLRKDRTIE